MSDETKLDRDTVKMLGPKGEVAFVSQKASESTAIRSLGWGPMQDIIPSIPKRGPGRPPKSQEDAD